jgi:hypothetical protein
LLLCCLLAAALAAPALAKAPPLAPRPKVGAPPWPAPNDPMRLARLAGLVPERAERLAYHVHSHLDVFVNGKRVVVPAGIGIDIRDRAVHYGVLADGTTAYGAINPPCPRVCISPLHTHGAYGVLHTETSLPVPNRLGQFFVEWGVRLDRRCVGGYCRPDSIRFYVDGRPYRGDPRQILLADRREIAVVIGRPPARIPAVFPPVPIALRLGKGHGGGTT